jgi:MFS transporter, DHA2 family, multidrug resistance protein
VPIILIGIVAVVWIVPESKDPRPGRVDPVGVALSIAGLVSLTYGIIRGGEHGFGEVQSWGAIALGLIILTTFIWFERRSDHPSLDVRLFREPRFSSAVAAVGLVFFAAMGTLFFLSFYLQLVRGFTPLQAGLLFTPFAVAQLIFAPLSASMVKRFGPRAVCATGLALVAVALAGFGTLQPTTPIVVLMALTFIQGVGMANVMPPATESVMSSLPREKAGVGSAVNNTIRQLGGALGVAVLGSVLSAVYRGQISDDLKALPAQAHDVAKESISGTYGVAERLGPAGKGLINAANDAFVSAIHWAAFGSAIVAVVGIVVVLVWMPRRSGPQAQLATTTEKQPRELAERR